MTPQERKDIQQGIKFYEIHTKYCRLGLDELIVPSQPPYLGKMIHLPRQNIEDDR